MTSLAKARPRPRPRPSPAEDARSVLPREVSLSPDPAVARRQRYALGLTASLTWGRAGPVRMTALPDRAIAPDQIIANVPEDVVTVFRFRMGGRDVRPIFGIGDFGLDLQDLNGAVSGSRAAPVQPHGHWPILTPSQGVVLEGQYSGDVPDGFVAGQPFLLCVTVLGPQVKT